jgi:hypothetical protein
MPPQSQNIGQQQSVVDDGDHSLSFSSIHEEVEKAARQAAMEVVEDFNDFSALRNDARANMVALFYPVEVTLDHSNSSSSGKATSGRHDIFGVYRLKGISLRDSHGRNPSFSDDMEGNRKRFADRSHEGYFSVKFAHRETLRQSSRAALDAACALAVEAKTLMNLPKHPHISQIYGVHAKGPKAGFANRVLEENYFIIVDEISETLKQRISAWRKNKSYAEERYDDLKQRQSEITQRLEVVVDIVSALEFLGNQNLVYLFHPGKCGFDARVGRIKLFEFGHSQESGKVPYYHFNEETDMSKRVYCAPEVLKGREVTVEADVYAVGMLLWEVLILKPPFHSMKREQHMKEVVKGEKRPRISSQFPPSLRKVMLDCWAPAKRPSMADVHDKLEDILLKGVDLTWKSEASTSSKTSRRIKRNQSHQPVSRQTSGIDNQCIDESNKVTSKAESPKVSTSRSKTIKYMPRRGAPADGKENDTKSAGSQSTRKTRKSRDSKRSLCTESTKIKTPSMRGTKVSSKDSPVTRSRQSSRFIEDNVNMSECNPSGRGRRSKSMDHSLRINSTSRKIKYEKAVVTKDDNDRRETKSLTSRKSVGSGKSNQKRVSPHQVKSLRNLLPLSPSIPKKDTGSSNFLESMKNQVASIRINLAGENLLSRENDKSKKDDSMRGRGIRRSVSAKRQSSRALQLMSCSSSSQEHMAPVNSKSFVTRRSLSRGKSLVVPPPQDHHTMRSPRIGLTKGISANLDVVGKQHFLQKSFSGLFETTTMVLGDPSRQAPVRSKSSSLTTTTTTTTIFTSSPNLKGISNNISSPDNNNDYHHQNSSRNTIHGGQGLISTPERQLSSDPSPFGSKIKSPGRSPGLLRGKVEPSFSSCLHGNLLLAASPKDGLRRIQHPLRKPHENDDKGGQQSGTRRMS